MRVYRLLIALVATRASTRGVYGRINEPNEPKEQKEQGLEEPEPELGLQVQALQQQATQEAFSLSTNRRAY